MFNIEFLVLSTFSFALGVVGDIWVDMVYVLISLFSNG